MAVGNVGEVIPNPSSESTGSYIWPANGNLSSRFGRRTTTVGSRNHKGIDITGRSGDPIFAADGGEVIVSGWSVSWGNVIRILHDNGDVTLYSHCSALLVKVGDRVSQGQQIARMGRTGVASGVHLHFELIVDGVNVDPLPHLP
jgi:murein DD-endopeptidase MepM/ murein hydrolase activator NlpD